MITTKNKEIFRILDLVCKKQADSLERLFTSINIIAKEQIVGFWWKSSVFEQAQEVIVLPMNITTDLIVHNPRLAL